MLSVLIAAMAVCGCEQPMTCPRVIYLDGAGWHSGDGPVREGLRRAGFQGAVERFNWQSLFGPLHDHVTADRHHPQVRGLARRVHRLRLANPDGRIVLIGLSAGTSLIVSALEALPASIAVDHVVLLSPSISSRHDLREALRRVRHRLYATNSPHDSLLAASASAGLERGRPAGEVGFQVPTGVTDDDRQLYRKVVNLPWRPEYAAYGWDGGHVSVTASGFIRVVIAPRILQDRPHPLDRLQAGDGVAQHD